MYAILAISQYIKINDDNSSQTKLYKYINLVIKIDLRGKSKSKDTELSQRKNQGNNTSDLFSHMNQDNLKYIQNQIKQKNKKSNQISIRKKSEEQTVQPSISRSYPSKIQEKQSKLQETQRQPNSSIEDIQQIKPTKTQGEIFNYAEHHDLKIRVEQSVQDNKLSYYDLVSQAKSKRVSSIQNFYQQQNQTGTAKEGGSFLNFLEGYIQDLNTKNNKKKITKLKQKNEQKNTISLSSASQKDILKNGLVKQQIKNMYLAKQIEQRRVQQKNHKKRIQNLEEVVSKLSEQLQILKNQMRVQSFKKPIQNKLTNNYTFHQKHDGSKMSHRKNLTSFTLASNNGPQIYADVHPQASHNLSSDQNINYLQPNYPINKNIGMGIGINPAQNQNYNSQNYYLQQNYQNPFNSRKSYSNVNLQHEQLRDIQREFKKFLQTGECQLHRNIKSSQYREYD